MEGSHADKIEIDKQLNDKERVAAAFEKPEIWLGLLEYLSLPSTFLERALALASESSNYGGKSIKTKTGNQVLEEVSNEDEYVSPTG